MDAKRIERLKITRNSKAKLYGFTFSRQSLDGMILWELRIAKGGYFFYSRFFILLSELELCRPGTAANALWADLRALKRSTVSHFANSETCNPPPQSA